MTTLISQELFDEALLECQELFDYSNEQAVQETITEFQSTTGSGGSTTTGNQNYISLEHLSLTHPKSIEGIHDRQLQQIFLQSVQQNLDLETIQTLFQDAVSSSSFVDPSSTTTPSSVHRRSNHVLMFWSLMLQQGIWEQHLIPNVHRISDTTNLDTILALVSFVVTVLPDSPSYLVFHPMSRKLKLSFAPSWFFVENNNNQQQNTITTTQRVIGNWFRLLHEATKSGNQSSSILLLVQMARKLCNGCEDNKKAFVQAALKYHNHEDDDGNNDDNIDKTGLDILIECLPTIIPKAENDDQDSKVTTMTMRITQEICQLVAILGKYQPLTEPSSSETRTTVATSGGAAAAAATPMVSSAHANVKELHRAGAVPRLHRIAKQCLKLLNDDDAENNNNNNSTASSFRGNKDNSLSLLCDSLAALRVMAIDNDIVQNMIALGILDTIHNSLEVIVRGSSSEQPIIGLYKKLLPLATATLGLVRNLCANDEVKTSICMSSLSSILHVMQMYLTTPQEDHDQCAATRGSAILLEHACGILGAMALRQPPNAKAIIDDSTSSGGHVLILEAMRLYPDKVTLQRQGCLALRNIASRLSDVDRVNIIESTNAEQILQTIAGKHIGSSEEAYAALRDLGCNPVLYNVDNEGRATNKSTTQMFGSRQSNFRPVYEE